MNRGTPAVESVKENAGPMPSRLRALAEIAGTAAAFALASSFSSLFQQASGASYLFAPAAVIFAASIAFGIRGVAGVALGTLFERWGGASTPVGAVAFMLVHGVTAGIGAWMLRTPVGGSGRRLQRVFAYGCLLPNLWSAIAGPLVLAGLGFIPRTVAAVIDTGLPWWMSDIAATCVLGAPLLLLLRPEALLTPADIDLMRDWLRRVF